jgi:multiple sugar transport system ATP-binding protein
VVRLAGHVAEQVGDTVHLSWSTDAVHLFDGETEKRLGR